LPLSVIHRLGALLGQLTYLFSPSYRRHLRNNLAQAGIDPALRLPVAAETGKQMLELSRIWMRPLEQANAQVVEVVGRELLDAAQQAGKGVVFLTPHLGCFEITAQYLSSFGDITVLYRPPKSAAAQQLILMGRKRAQLHLAPADLSGVRALIKALKKEFPAANIVPVDYDPGASEVNQLNRIKLMLAAAFKNLEEEERLVRPALHGHIYSAHQKHGQSEPRMVDSEPGKQVRY
jgi:lauroyl/myristoyl acyltransferase